MKQKLLIILFLFSFFPAFYSCVTSNRVSITNETEFYIDDFHLFAGSEEIWSGKLKPGEKKRIFFSAKGDGAFSVLKGLEDGSMYRVEELGYFTPKDGQQHELILKKQNRVFYQLGK